jgi:osmotically inducible protein OsmC
MPAKAHAEWLGELKTGKGAFTAGDSLGAEYSFNSRFEDGPGANPEQLLGAALASCFSMALANMLAQDGTPAESVATDAVVRIRRIDDKPTVAEISLTAVGRVPGIDENKFREFAEATKDDCIVRRALAGVEDVKVDASLAT